VIEESLLEKELNATGDLYDFRHRRIHRSGY